jgi:hypothetical protein
MLQEKVADAADHFTSRQRAAVQREVVRLLDELAPERPPQRRDTSQNSVSVHRWPARCILQGESTAVSVSWFPARPAEEALGEILVIAWDGVISVPGITPKGNEAPQARESVTLLPVEQEDGDFKWRQNGALMPMDEVVNYCRGLLGD